MYIVHIRCTTRTTLLFVWPINNMKKFIYLAPQKNEIRNISIGLR